MVNDVLSLLIIDTQKLSLTLYSNSIDDNYLIMTFNIVHDTLYTVGKTVHVCIVMPGS